MNNNEMKTAFEIPSSVVKAIVKKAITEYFGNKFDEDDMYVEFKISKETLECGSDKVELPVFNGCEIICVAAYLTGGQNNAD